MAATPSNQLATIVEQLTSALRSQAATLEAVKAELSALRAGAGVTRQPPGVEPTPEAEVVEATNFRATGPGTGFFAQAGTVGGMDRGVWGFGTNQTDPERAIGVQGSAVDLDVHPSNGTGVLGTTAGGVGVKGVNVFTNGVAVQGISETGVGVEGTGNPISVLGSGGVIGVEGSGEQIGVLGGAVFGPVLDPANQIAVGMLGNALPNFGDLSASYGGWFDAGATGTAPVHLEPSPAPGPPQIARQGDLFVDSAGRLWFCVGTGDNAPNPATWKEIQMA
jgi:hypothetical protein